MWTDFQNSFTNFDSPENFLCIHFKEFYLCLSTFAKVIIKHQGAYFFETQCIVAVDVCKIVLPPSECTLINIFFIKLEVERLNGPFTHTMR